MPLPSFDTTLDLSNLGVVSPINQPEPAPSYVQRDAIGQIAAEPDSGLFTAGGLFSKVVDTLGSVWIAKETAKIGSVYPTGQNNPSIPRADQVAANGPTAPGIMAAITPYIPLLLIGAVVIVGGAFALRALRK